MDAGDDANWAIAGDTFGLIFSQACVAVGSKDRAFTPPDPSKSPSPTLLLSQEGVKSVIDISLMCIEDMDTEDARSTVGGASILAEDSRSTVWQEEFGGDLELDEARTLARDVLLRGIENGSLYDALSTAFEEQNANIDLARQEVAVSLQGAAADGRLAAALATVAPEDALHLARKEVAIAMQSAAADGRLAAALAVVEPDESIDLAKKEVELAMRSAATDGRLAAALATVAPEQTDQDGDELRLLARNVISAGLANGRLDAVLAEASAQQTALVPRPPAAGSPKGKSSRPAWVRKQLPGSSAEQLFQVISEADRRSGALQAQIAEKERQLRDRGALCEKLTRKIQGAHAELDHLAIDLHWHQEQIVSTEDRWGRLNENRRALALQLDEMRFNRLKDCPAEAKPSQTGHSWASTDTGGALTAIDDKGGNSGWTTQRSALSGFQ